LSYGFRRRVAQTPVIHYRFDQHLLSSRRGLGIFRLAGHRISGQRHRLYEDREGPGRAHQIARIEDRKRGRLCHKLIGFAGAAGPHDLVMQSRRLYLIDRLGEIGEGGASLTSGTSAPAAAPFDAEGEGSVDPPESLAKHSDIIPVQAIVTPACRAIDACCCAATSLSIARPSACADIP
jgi:hypothetical protein